MQALKPIIISGREVLPLVEGGKGISISNGESSGAWAASGGVGTFSGVNADSFDENGQLIEQAYHGKTRRERHEELIAYAIQGGIYQARIAHEIAGGQGRIHMNVLWEMAAAERILHGVLEGAKGLIHGVTCGAGMPYRIAEICASYGIYYYPIVSSARAFRALWKRAYHKFRDWLGGVVYEDPWLAGGHNGLSNSEDPNKPEDPYPRVVELRRLMVEECGLVDTPIFMAGGVWYLREWEHWIGNPELGPDRLPIRHEAAADPGEPDLRWLEAPPPHAGGGRRLPESLQPDRILFLGGQQPLHPGAARSFAIARWPIAWRRWASMNGPFRWARAAAPSS